MEALCRCRCSKTPAWWGRVSIAVCACKAHARRSRRSATGPDWSRRTRSTESCRHALSDLGCGRLSFFSSPKLYSSNDSIGIHQCCRRSRAKGCGRRTRSFDAPEYKSKPQRTTSHGLCRAEVRARRRPAMSSSAERAPVVSAELPAERFHVSPAFVQRASLNQEIEFSCSSIPKNLASLTCIIGFEESSHLAAPPCRHAARAVASRAMRSGDLPERHGAGSGQ